MSNAMAQAKKIAKEPHPSDHPTAIAKGLRLYQPIRQLARSKILGAHNEAQHGSARREEGTLTHPSDEEASAQKDEVDGKADDVGEPDPETPTVNNSSWQVDARKA